MKTSFNNGWTFLDSKGKTKIVDVPHDAMIEEERKADNPSGSNCAFFSGGNYTYEREFFVPDEWKTKIINFEFEGIYRKSQVYINDKLAGECDYGYIPFWVGTKDLLNYGSSNKIQVKVHNNDQPNCRWYSGSGIYRPVWIWVQDPIRILPEGIRITTLSHSPAEIQITTKHEGGQISIEIFDKEKMQSILTTEGDNVKFVLPNAKLWSDEHPNLYICRVTLKDGEKTVESRDVTFGVRTISWSSKGLLINGQQTLLRGGCIHHDHGILGAKTYEKSERRRVRKLKEAGFNALRSSHNPVSSALISACDEYGLYLMDETWDMWYKPKLQYDYALDFEKCFKHDIESMVNRDYNHPSVIFYSIGNEVAEPHEERGIHIEKEMIDLCHKLDQTRPVTLGFNIMIVLMATQGKSAFSGSNENKKKDEQQQQESQQPNLNSSEAFNMLTQQVGKQMNLAGNSPEADKASSPGLDLLDIAGYNYASGRYELDPEQHPNRVVIGSETFPSDIWHNWQMVKKYPHLIGDFVWTAWDYIGETGAGAWAYTNDAFGFSKPYPWLLADVGAFDILGNENAELGYAQIVWGTRKGPYLSVQPVNHQGFEPIKAVWRGTNALPSWSWKGCEGNDAKVEVFTDSEKVDLFLNGKKVGSQKVEEMKVLFNIHYEYGVLEAVCFDADGKEVERTSLVSSNVNEQRISLIPEENEVTVNDIVYIDVTICDSKGIVESNDDVKIKLGVQGGELLAFGRANPRTEERFDKGEYTTYYGRALAVVKCTQKGTVNVAAEDQKGRKATAQVHVI